MRVQERIAAVALERYGGNTLLIHLGWGLLPSRATFKNPC